MNYEKYIKVRDKLISRGKITPTEAMLYERCYHFYQSQKAKGEYYFIDQLEAALFFRVTRRTMGKMIKNLEAVGLLVRTGQLTQSRNICYEVQDWERIQDQVLMSDAEYAALVQTYVDERGSNRAALVAYMAAQEAPESIAEPEAVQPQPEVITEPQEAVQEQIEPMPLWSTGQVNEYLKRIGRTATPEQVEHYRFTIPPERMNQ